MKEETIKALIKKSKRETSADFTDELMEKIAQQQHQKNALIWPYKIVFGITVFLLIAISYLIFKRFDMLATLSDISLKNYKSPVLFIVFGLLFFILNAVVRLYGSHKDMERGMATTSG